MRLRTRLVLAATCVTLAMVLALALPFLGELLHQRISQTAASDDLMMRQLVMVTRQALEIELASKPPADRTPDAFNAAVTGALRSHAALLDTMNAFVRYSPAVQDVSVTDARGLTLISTDPGMWDRRAPIRSDFGRLEEEGVLDQAREVFGTPQVLDVAMPLERNSKPFLVVHLGVRSTFLKNNYLPSLQDGLLVAALGAAFTMIAAAVLASLALRPIEEISRRLERLAGRENALAARRRGNPDAVVRATRTIERLGEQMQTTEAGYTDLQANLAQVLDTLRDGVLLFTSEQRAAMASDAVANFVETDGRTLVGRALPEIFRRETQLGRAVLDAFERQESLAAAEVKLEDGRTVEISVDPIRQRDTLLGTLLTLHDAGSAIRLEKELEVSRRLAAVGRLTAGVGHEVKNPINAMVVHLELLKGKLAANPDAANGAQRHVEILAGEMERLDRVVQTLADFTRPLELHLSDVNLGGLAQQVMELTGAEMEERGVRWVCAADGVTVRADGELLRQALLNLVLNGMQAMPEGGLLKVSVYRDGEMAVLSVEDEGCGIEPELLPRIFELYFTTKAKGSGIGLAMTYRIVQMHGGALDVRSEVATHAGDRHGSIFTVRLAAIFPRVAELRPRALAGRVA